LADQFIWKRIGETLKIHINWKKYNLKNNIKTIKNVARDIKLTLAEYNLDASQLQKIKEFISRIKSKEKQGLIHIVSPSFSLAENNITFTFEGKNQNTVNYIFNCIRSTIFSKDMKTTKISMSFSDMVKVFENNPDKSKMKLRILKNMKIQINVYKEL
jgi:hypothetical protein